MRRASIAVVGAQRMRSDTVGSVVRGFRPKNMNHGIRRDTSQRSKGHKGSSAPVQRFTPLKPQAARLRTDKMKPYELLVTEVRPTSGGQPVVMFAYYPTETRKPKSVPLAELFRVQIERFEDKECCLHLFFTQDPADLMFVFDNEAHARSVKKYLQEQLLLVKKFPESVCEGNLKKRRHNKRGMDFRWFVLENSQLYYFTSLTDSESSDKKINIGDITFVGDVQLEDEQFSFDVRTLQRTWTLSAADEQDRRRWIQGIRMSMRIEKEVCTWGDCQFGQLGNGIDVLKAFDTPVVVQHLNSKDVVGIAAGKDHVLAVLGDGTVASWGRGDIGQLGQGDVITCSAPRIIHALDSVVVTSVVASDGVSACITDDGAVYQWGRMLKATPDGTTLAAAVYSPEHRNGLAGARCQSADMTSSQLTLLLPGFFVRHLSVGPYHAGAVTDSASLFMWGTGFTGALGVGNRVDHVEPVEVVFPHSSSADVWSQVACGYWHTLAVTEQGLTYSWGSGEAGQLGHGAKDCFDSPKQIEALSHIRMETIAAGMFNSAGITVENVLFCWGKGENGQIGTGKSGPTALSVKVPTKVDIRADPSSKELSKVTSVVCSDTMTAVLTSAGECVMFGVGRFVNGDQHDILEPLPVRQPALFDPVPCALCIC
jgi:alpha-tubulin suppressor-like RCC1 family protein